MTEGFSDIRCHLPLLPCQGGAGGTGWPPCAEESPSRRFRDCVLLGGHTPPLRLWIDVFMVTALLPERLNELISIFELRAMCQAGCYLFC